MDENFRLAFTNRLGCWGRLRCRLLSVGTGRRSEKLKAQVSARQPNKDAAKNEALYSKKK